MVLQSLKIHIYLSLQIDFMSHQNWKIGCVNHSYTFSQIWSHLEVSMTIATLRHIHVIASYSAVLSSIIIFLAPDDNKKVRVCVYIWGLFYLFFVLRVLYFSYLECRACAGTWACMDGLILIGRRYYWVNCEVVEAYSFVSCTRCKVYLYILITCLLGQHYL